MSRLTTQSPGRCAGLPGDSADEPAGRRLAGVLAMLLLVAALAAGCSSGDGTGETAGDDTTTDTAAVAATSDTQTPAGDPDAVLADATDMTQPTEPAETTDSASPDGAAPTAGTPAADPNQPLNEKELRDIATQRFLKARKAVAPFPRAETMVEILKRDFGVDYRSRFPDGYDPAAFLSRDEILLRVQQDLEAEADRKYPPAARERLVEEAKALYPLYRKGDTVRVLLGNGRMEEGTIQYLGADFVQVGLRKVPLADIVKPDVRAFDPEKTQTMRDHHVAVNYDNDRQQFLTAGARERVPALLRENGFVNVNGEAVRIDTLIAKKVMPEVTRREIAYVATEEARIKAEVRTQMEEEGLVQPRSLEAPDIDLFADLVQTTALGETGEKPSVIFIIKANDCSVNASPQTFPLKRDSLIAALGEPTREVELLVNHCLVWDDMGLSAFVNPTTSEVDEITLYYAERDRSMRQFPRSLFSGRVEVDGVPIMLGSDPAEINKRLSQRHYAESKSRPGTWLNPRDAFEISLTLTKSGVQTVRITSKTK